MVLQIPHDYRQVHKLISAVGRPIDFIESSGDHCLTLQELATHFGPGPGRYVDMIGCRLVFAGRKKATLQTRSLSGGETRQTWATEKGRLAQGSPVWR